jgi:phospholipid/cholesterol/gamma-HCH transport system substrate-binding protein
MKFSIRFADQIVGALIILALGMLIFVIFMLGSSQRWFSDDYYYISYFPTASGLSQNMAVQYKGFTIGYVKSIRLSEDDQVEVRFTIFDTYIDRVRQGSIVEVLISPIGGLGGSQFIFYPGTGTELLPEGETIPSAGSAEGRRLLAVGLAQRPERDDNINNIVNSVGNTLETLNSLLTDVQEAISGTDKTSLGRTMGGVEAAAAGLQVMAEKLPTDFEDNLGSLMAQLRPVLANLQEFTDRVADPDGSISAILDSEGDVYRDLSKSLDSLSGTLRNLEQTTDFIPSQLPQVAVVINDLHMALQTFEDVLVSLTNNPLLKQGVPERKETKAGGARTRDLEF